MSEYQYYEWQTVDRLLTEAEQEAVSRLSSHMDVSASRAIVTYSWSDFKHDPQKVLVRFFDAHLYMANWGSRRLMFRFPAGLLNRDEIKAYYVPDRITYKAIGKFDVLDLNLSEEEGGDWIEGEGSLSGLVPLRNDILQGDHRILYLAWLKAMSLQDDESPDDQESAASSEMDPPIPCGLRHLSAALKRFVDEFDVPASLVDAAARASPEMVEPSATDFSSLVSQLSREECDRFLCRFARGDTSAVMELKKRLLSLNPCPPAVQAVRLSIGELLKRADEIEKERQRRRQEEARRKHAAEMDALAGREAEAWQEVESLVEMKLPKHYEAAVQMLAKLKKLSEFRELKADYRQRLNDLCERYSNRPGFKSRVQRAKLLE